MMKRNYLFLVLIAVLIGACSDLDFVLPKGDQGEKGLSAYEDWVSMVEKGIYPEWIDHTEKVDFMKFLTGSNGASAYDVWKDLISSGKVEDPHNPGKMWDATRNSVENFFEFLTGAKGDPGIPGSTVTINDNGNWEIDGKDTGIPARGQHGDSAYQIWVKKVLEGKMPDKADPSKPWDASKVSLADFWEYFSGKPGANGLNPTVGDNGNWWLGDKDTGVPARGQDGASPTIGDNGNWWIGGKDTGVPAKGQDGYTPTIGDNGNWWFGDKDTGVPARGQDGKTPTIGDNGNWWFGDKDTGVPAKGQDGNTPHIGSNGNWWIGAIDTGVPAQGIDGATPEIGENGNWWIDGKDTGKPSKGQGTPGESAYDLWKKEVAKGTLKNPHSEAPGYEGEFWNISKTSLYDFWFYLRGKDGKDGQDGDVEIIKGKPNVLAEYFNSKTKEYIDPRDGSATFVVYDKLGVKAPAGSIVKGLPTLDASASFTTDDHSYIYVPRELLPNKRSLEERSGITLSVTINGETLPSAANTVVPNRVNTRISLKDVYLRPNSPWDWNRSYSVNDFTVVKFIYEREIDGIWTSTETYKDQNRLAVMHIKDINKPISRENLVEDLDDVVTNPHLYKDWGNRRGVGGSPNNPTTPFFDITDGIFLVYRPIVLTADEINYDINEGTRYPNDYRMDWILKQLEAVRYYQWDGTEHYVTLVGLDNYYGEHPIMNAKIHNPEIYPSPSLKDVKYRMNNGSSALIGRFDEATIAPVYKEFALENDVWKSQKYDKVLVQDGPGFQISMTKFTEVESGSTELSIKSTYDDLSFALGSAYPNNVITTRVFSYWHLPETGRLGDCNSFYRLRPIFDFYNKGTTQNPKFVLKDIYGSTEYSVPIIK